MPSVARWEILTIRRFSDSRSSLHLEFAETLGQAQIRRLDMIAEFVNLEGMDQVSHDDRQTVLEMRSMNSLESDTWDSLPDTVTLCIRAAGVAAV